MGKAVARKKIEGYKKQISKHIKKFNEAKKRGSEESMDYMAKEISNYLEQVELLKKKLLPKKTRMKSKK